ncbi:retrovirus-related pol polyprotein from transposon TNT 1-94 [Tanacetum coccineum]
MLDKQNDPISIKHKINISPIDYSKLNKIKEDFGKCFVTKKELSVEQAFWLKHSTISETPVTSHTPVRIEAPSELPKVSLVNENHKKLKYHLASFDKVVKKRTTSDAITAGAWGFEHTKACFQTEIIPFIKVLKVTFNAFDKTLLDEITEVQNVFNQMEAVEIMHIVVNSVDILDMSNSFVDECNKCPDLETELFKKNDFIEKDVYDKLSVENLDLNAQLQEKVFAIAALKNELRKLKGKNVVDTTVSTPTATIIAPGMFKINLEPLAPKLLKSNDVHMDYIKHSRDNADTLREIVKNVTALSPLDSNLDSACKYVQIIQEVLIYVKETCPCLSKPSEKLVAVTLSQLSCSNKTNKVEDQSRSVKSRKNKKNHVSEPISNALVKHFVRNAKFESICAICNECLFDANHDKCVLDYIHDVNVLSKSKNVKRKNIKRKEWKPTGIIVYSRRPKATRSVGSSSKVKSVEFKTPNTKEPNQSWGSTFLMFHLLLLSIADYQMGNVTISRVYYMEGLGHNLFSVGQFCDSDLEVAFRKHTCFIRDLEGVDLLKASKTKSWLSHQRLSHLNIDYITSLAKQGLVIGLPELKYQKYHVFSAYAFGKSKKHSHKPKAKYSIQEKLYLLHMDLCGPMRIQSINGRKYILVIVDDYSRFTWLKFLRSKDEVPEFVIKFLKMIQGHLNATVRNIRTDNGT